MTTVSSSERIHPTASVHPRAELHPSVEVGAGCVVGENVRIGAGTKLYPHVVIDGWTTIGCDNRLYPGAAIGLEPQDLTYRGAPSRVEIGDRNAIREYVTVNRATEEGEVTRIGDDNLIMAYSHVAHNCKIDNSVIIANSVALAGYVCIESQARISGLLGIHQFTHIGRLAMVGGMARIDRDVPPYTMVEGNPGRIRGLNLVGLRRSGWKTSDPAFKQLKEAYRLLYRSSGHMEEALQELSTWTDSELVNDLVTFLKASIHGEGRRGPLPTRKRRGNTDSGNKDSEKGEA